MSHPYGVPKSAILQSLPLVTNEIATLAPTQPTNQPPLLRRKESLLRQQHLSEEGEKEGRERRNEGERIFLFISSILREFDLRLKSILFLRRLALPSRGQVFSLSSMVCLSLRSPHDGTILEGN